MNKEVLGSEQAQLYNQHYVAAKRRKIGHSAFNEALQEYDDKPTGYYSGDEEQKKEIHRAEKKAKEAHLESINSRIGYEDNLNIAAQHFSDHVHVYIDQALQEAKNEGVELNYNSPKIVPYPDNGLIDPRD